MTHTDISVGELCELNTAATERDSGALAISGLSAGYGSTPVLHGVSLEVGAGEIVCVLGRNGVGKSTLLKAVIGILRPTGGTVSVGSRDVTRLRSHRVAREGVAYAAQEQGLFANLSVRDNLRLASGKKLDETISAAAGLFPFIASRLDQRVGTLSGGEQKMLLTARALAGQPKLALLDEISEGVQPSLIAGLREAVVSTNASHGTAVLLVEQNLDFALSVASRFYVLEKGHVVASGATDDDDAESLIGSHLVV
jgi:branched-chain amino acid transport system ATP-binding protein